MRRRAPLHSDRKHRHPESPTHGSRNKKREQGHPFRPRERERRPRGARRKSGGDEAAPHADGVDDGTAEHAVGDEQRAPRPVDRPGFHVADAELRREVVGGGDREREVVEGLEDLFSRRLIFSLFFFRKTVFFIFSVLCLVVKK